MVAEFSQSQPFNADEWIEMQSKIAFQEDSMQQLNDIVAQQQQDILNLQGQMKELIKELNNVLGDLESGVSGQSANERPPHY